MSQQGVSPITAERDGTSRKMLSVPEVADLLGVQVGYVRRLVYEKRITHLKIGAKLRFRQVDVDKFIADSVVEAEQPPRVRRA